MRNEEGLEFHLHLKAGDVGRYVLLPGDPARCEKIAAYFEHRPFCRSKTGNLMILDGERFWGRRSQWFPQESAAPPPRLRVEELVEVGADTFIRVGSSGAIQPDGHRGDVAIVTASIRDEGTTPQYLPVEFPAVADLDVVTALRTAARQLKVPYHVGVAQSKDSFYGEVERGRMPLAGQLEERWNAWGGWWRNLL